MEKILWPALSDKLIEIRFKDVIEEFITTFNRLWNALGHPRSQNYDEN